MIEASQGQRRVQVGKTYDVRVRLSSDVEITVRVRVTKIKDSVAPLRFIGSCGELDAAIEFGWDAFV